MQRIDAKREGVAIVYRQAKHTFAVEMGKILVGFYEGLISVVFPPNKPATKQFWVYCPNCKRFHPLEISR